MFLIGVAIFLFGVFMSYLITGGHLSAFVLLPLIMLQILSIVGVLAATRSFKVFAVGLYAAIFSKKEVSKETLDQSVSLFRLLSKITMLSSLIWFIYCVIHIFGSIGDMSVLLSSLTTSIVGPFWGLVLVAGVFEPLVFILKKRRKTLRRQKQRD